MNGTHLPSILVANKSDSVEPRKVKVEEGKSLAKLWGVPYIEVSAKRHTSDVISNSTYYIFFAAESLNQNYMNSTNI